MNGLFYSSPPSTPPPGLQTPILNVNNTKPYEKEKFTVRCSAPEEKGPLIFRFYQKFSTGEVSKIKELKLSGNSLEITLVLKQTGDSILYCNYEVNLISGSRYSNSSAETQILVKRNLNRL